MQFVRIAAWSNVLMLLGAPLANLLVFMTAAPILAAFRLFYYGTYVPHHPPKGHLGPMPWHVGRSSEVSRLLSFLTCYHFDLHWEHHRWYGGGRGGSVTWVTCIYVLFPSTGGHRCCTRGRGCCNRGWREGAGAGGLHARLCVGYGSVRCGSCEAVTLLQTHLQNSRRAHHRPSPLRTLVLDYRYIGIAPRPWCCVELDVAPCPRWCPRRPYAPWWQLPYCRSLARRAGRLNAMLGKAPGPTSASGAAGTEPAAAAAKAQ